MDRTITTIGSGSASGVPDAMRIGLAVVGHGSTVADALAACASGVGAVSATAREHVAEDRVRSTGLNVWPRHDNEGRQAGYEARHSLTVTCDGLENAGRLVTALGDLEGRVLVDGVEPVISAPGPLAASAREQAYADARAKAEELASYAGLTVTGVLAVVEGGAAEIGHPRMLAAEAAMPFEAGTLSVSATLTVTWSAAGG